MLVTGCSFVFVQVPDPPIRQVDCPTTRLPVWDAAVAIAAGVLEAFAIHDGAHSDDGYQMGPIIGLGTIAASEAASSAYGFARFANCHATP